MNSGPVVSVIVPIYNVEDYLEECINSILAQSYTNLEVILIDDGSTDGSGKICDYYAQIDSRVKVFHKSNGGVSSARNFGIRNATGTYIGFIDGDDYIEPQMYQSMLKNILSNKAQMCVNLLYLKDNKVNFDCQVKEGIISGDDAIKKLLQMNFPTSLWSCLYYKEIIENEYLNENIHFWEDFEFQMRLLYKSKIISIYNYPLYHYRYRDGSANNQIINDKIISCLDIAPIVDKAISNKYPYLKKYSDDLYVIFLLRVIDYLSKSQIIEQKYFRIITTYSRKYFGVAFKSKQFSFIKKFYIILCAINSKFYYLIYKNIGVKIKRLKSKNN